MKIKKEKGTVFLTTLIVVFLMSLTSGFVYQMATQDLHLINRLKYSTQAQQLADAGLYRALSLLNSSWSAASSSSNFPLTTLSPGTYDASVTSTNGKYLVSCTGTAYGVARQASAEVIAPALSALDFALAGGGNVAWDPGTGQATGTLTGNIYAGGNLSMGGTINGDVYYGGNISGTNNGSRTNNAGGLTFPTITSSYYQNIAQANGQYFAGNKTYSSTSPIPANPAGGVIYVAGNITIAHTQTTTATIFAGGNITIQKTPSPTAQSSGAIPKITINQYSNYPAMVALGNITISSTGNSSGGASFMSTGLIYSGGNFTITGNHYDNPKVNITGSIVARGNLTTSLTAANNLFMTYQKQSPPGFSSGNSSMKIVSYNT